MRRFLIFCVPVLLASCLEGGAPAPEGDWDFDPTPIDGDAGCTAEGCVCDPGSLPVECYEAPSAVDGNLVCGVGTQYCRGGAWSGCEHIETFHLEGMASLIEGPVECNPCDPDCSTSRDRPDDGDLTDDNSDNVEYDPARGGITIPPSSHGTPTSPDRDRDGIPDIADDCPTVPGDPDYFGCPTGTGEPGLFHELPFGGPTEIDPCVINVQVRTVDVYFLVDTTGSMGGEISNLRSGLTSGTLIAGCPGGVIGAIRCEIPDAWFGVGFHDDYPVTPYGGAAYGDQVYRNLMDLEDNSGRAQTAVNSLSTHWGYDWPESQSQALYAVASGNGLGSYLAPRSGCPAGRFGYPCFRPDAIPVIVLFTDAPPHNGTWGSYNYSGTIGGLAASAVQMRNAIVSRGMKVISIESSGANGTVMQDLRAVSYATGSVNAAGVPFIFSIPSNGSGLSTAIVDAVRELADYSRVDVSAVCIDNPATAGINECDFVSSIIARPWGPRGSCQSRSGARYNGCLPGTDTNFEIAFHNDVIMGMATSQVFNFDIRVLYNDSVVAGTKEVRIVVPPTVPACATVEVMADRVIPNVMTLIDQSGSMGNSFPGSSSRWNAVRDTMIGVTGTGADRGIIGELEAQVRFGLQTYTSSFFSSRGCGGSATRGVTAMNLNNFGPINSFYRPQRPGGGTPTSEALREVYNAIIASPPADGPPIVILATDGEPNGCATNARAAVVAETARGFSAGIRTFVISVGNAIGESHLQDVANAGVGVGSGAPYWVATDSAGLRAAIRGIISGTMSCELDTSGTIDPDIACFGDVMINGRSLVCEGPNGWSLVDEDTIVLNGTACDELQTDPDAVVTGSFPCPPVTGSYWRVYDATESCEIPPTRPNWGPFTWVADTPPNTTIEFQFRTAGSEAGLATAMPVGFGVPDDGLTPPVNIGAFLGANGQPQNLPYLQMTTILSGSVDRTRTPALTETNLEWVCEPME